MRTTQAPTIHLKDYQPPEFLVDTIELSFDLGEEETRVRSKMQLRRNPEGSGDGPLHLDGEAIELVSVTLDSVALKAEQYELDEQGLRLPNPPSRFALEIETLIKPQENTELSGLYRSSDMFCTQCEAEGFRRITYYPDRPDVMARFTTTIVGDLASCPVMLSNGNRVAMGQREDGRHWVRWKDPHRKPAYLFALVAGDLAHIQDSFTTRSGRDVTLRIYTEAHNVDRCDHAMAALKRAMAWDEAVFGREYDLDIYMIVAVDDFNMGAMENKGLNIFNSQLLLARPETATDADYEQIEAVVAHEYFHNWSGNRVTCRDWFQLSLKEGLTVFRDQQFTADMTSAAVKRIRDVRLLRANQFPEDSGPLAHPVRPDSYVEINNFYTVTVYEKGAEVVRMIHTLLGADVFREGLDLYFERHDGAAVTCEDFVSAMEDASGVDLRQFRLWYSLAGTPQLQVEDEFDADSGEYRLTLRQHCPDTPGQSDKPPMHLPVALGLLSASGERLPLQLAGEDTPGPTTRVLSLQQRQQVFSFVGLSQKPLPSLLRGFSAPVVLDYDYSDQQLGFLMRHDEDPFMRWEAGQQLATRVLLAATESLKVGGEVVLDPGLTDSFRELLMDESGDKRLVAEALTLPSEAYLSEQVEVVDPIAIHTARSQIRVQLAEALLEPLLQVYRANHTEQYRSDSAAVSKRLLANCCLGYLAAIPGATGVEYRQIALSQLETADNMTDQLAALASLSLQNEPEWEAGLDRFYEQWQAEPLVVNKWLSVQASAPQAATFERVSALLQHPGFNIQNPNKVRALLGGFARNPLVFHQPDGAGYRLLAEQILRLDAINPQIAARMALVFNRWRRFESAPQTLMRGELEGMLATESLSKDLYEIVSKSLA
ncbi:MAG: aminopeptidase N [Gammaproteobacteria bacterium]|nr:aminopeptidase N [Gammaproteobacteria bacterium]